MAIYERGREFELGTTEQKSSKWPEQDSNPGPPDCESDALTTRPRCLPFHSSFTIKFLLQYKFQPICSPSLECQLQMLHSQPRISNFCNHSSRNSLVIDQRLMCMLKQTSLGKVDIVLLDPCYRKAMFSKQL